MLLDRTRTRFDDAEIRVDGREKVSGRTAYTADVSRPDMLWVAFARSPYAHARILSIDAKAARAMPGVAAVITADDIGRRRFGRRLFDYPVLAFDRVLFVGERVAAVAAETEEAAAEAARMIDVAYEELEPILDTGAALADGAPILHPDKSAYHYAGDGYPEQAHPNLQGSVTLHKGHVDLEPLFATAYRVYEHVFATPRQHHGYIEPHATLVWIDDDGTVRVHSPCKSPYQLRDRLAIVAELPPERIVVEPIAIGGDFGGKGLTVDEFACYFLARATRRPVKHVCTYIDELGAMNVRHASRVTLRTGVDRDGTFLVHRADVDYDGGAYAAGKPGPTLVPGGDLGFASVAYHIDNVHIDVRTIYTNTVPGGNMRSPADVQTLFAWESHVDLIARDLGLDPIDVRLRNAVNIGDTALTGEAMHEPRAREVLQALKTAVRKRPALAPNRGRGVAFACRHTGGGTTSLDLRLMHDGAIEILTGVPDQGSGSATVIRRVIAAELGIAGERISIRHGSTYDARTDPGAGASRVTRIVGGAALDAARTLRAKMERASGLRLRDGAFVVEDSEHVEFFEDVAARCCADEPLVVVGRFGTHDSMDHQGDFSCSAFAIDVAVDPQTGAVRIVDALFVVDVATIINPIAHQGQIEGGFVYGVGGALMEELPLDGGKITTLSLGEYKLPTIADLPPLTTLHVGAAAASGPFGAKMAGELSNSGVAPAIANAVAAAVGARLYTFPITAERVFDAMHA